MASATVVGHPASWRSVAVGLTAVLLATIGMHASPPSARAADEVSVVASGGVSAGFGQYDTFSVAASDDGAGSLTGSVRMTRSGQPSDGTVTCLAVNGADIIVGGATTPYGQFPPPVQYFTLYLTDNGPTGTLDTVAFDGPTESASPDCGLSGPLQQPLTYGQVTILAGPSDSGTVSGHGTSPIGTSGTRTFDFDAQRAPDGTVTGTYDIHESQGFSTSGQVVCLDIRGGRATIIGQGTDPNGGGMNGGGTLYATFFVDDVGSYGSGDRIAVNAYTNIGPPTACLAAQEDDSLGVVTGYIDVNGVGGGATPPAAATVVGSGAIQTGQDQADTFEVAAISDGSGGVDGTIRVSRSGSSVGGSITCLRVVGGEIVVGGQGTIPSGGGGGGTMTAYFTLYLTDNGPDGTTDSAFIDGPTTMAPPDCHAASPPQQGLWYGQVTIIDGPSEYGIVSGDGTMDLGSGYSRTFSFDAVRNVDGVVSGTFSVSESQGFALSGTVDCLDIRGERAMLIGHGPDPQGGFGSFYWTIFIEDGGAGGAGDLMSVNAGSSNEPFSCLAAQEYPGESLASGDVDINAGATPAPTTATPSHPVIATVTSPNAGAITVTEATTSDPPPAGSGYAFLGHQLDITAPDADTVNPLTLVFSVDAGLLASADPDLTATTVTVFRNGTPVGPCTPAPDDDPASPNPCVSLRETLAGAEAEGDARITVLASAASAWNFGSLPVAGTPGYYGIALGLTSELNAVYALNESGAMAGVMNDQRLTRIEGSTVTPLSGGTGFVTAMNESGTFVGGQNDHPVRVDGTTVTPVPGLGGVWEGAYDIDAAGTTIVGVSSDASGVTRAWIHDAQGTTELPSLGGDYTFPQRITETGLVVGVSRTASGETHIVSWQTGAIADLGTPAGSSYAGVTDANGAGWIIGSYGIPYVGTRAFLWNGSTLADLAGPSGSETFVSDINEAGQIVGSSRNAAGAMRAVVWEGGAVRDIGTLGGATSYGGSINDAGQVTGTADTAGGEQHGFLMDDGVMHDLNDLVPAHTVEITSAERITNSGYILAGAESGPVLLVPGIRPDAPYEVIDLGESFGSGANSIGATDMNASHQATGAVDYQAYVYDGTSSSKLFPGYVESGGAAIDSTGRVAGSAQHGAGYEAFLYDGSVQFLGTLGGASSNARDLNDAGEVVGSADTSNGQRHAFVYRGGVMTDIQPAGDTGSEAVRISDAGMVVGYSYDAPYTGAANGFVNDGTTTTDLGTLGGPMTIPYAINNAGEIVGTSSTSTQVNVAFRYADGAMASIAPPGSTGSEGIDINEAGTVAGSYVDGSGSRYPFIYDDGAFTLIPGMGGSFATATDINARGQVVGYASTSSATRGYLFDAGNLIDLTAQLPLGYEATVTVARKIGDDGAILVHGRTADFRDRVLLLIPAQTQPVPDPLTIDTSLAAPGSVTKYGRFERPFQLSRPYGADANDPGVIEVSGRFVAPSGATFTVPAYFGTDYQVQAGSGMGSSEAYVPVPSATGIWHVRFSPDEVGTWTYTLRARDHLAGQETTVVSPAMTFAVTASGAKGQVERDPRDDQYLRYRDGTPYLPMGHNVAFQQGEPVGNDGEHYIEPLFASMEAAGQNWTRIWMTDFNRNALEWSAGHWAGWYTGAGQYADQSAFRIERQLDVAEAHGLQVQLVLEDHGQVRDINDDGGRWDENPYNAANGGPVPAANPEQFFTDPEAKRLFQQRLRYLVARYGAYRNLLAWELFNEVQFVGSDAANPYNSAQVRDDIVAWHAEMAAYLRSIDPYDHLITTSSDIESSLKDIWADPNIDLVQVHDYESDLTTRDTRFRGYVASLNATYQKPVIIGEFGIAGDPEIDFDPVAATPLDDREAHLLQATHLHNGAWAAAMSGSGAMSWWWGAYIHTSPSKNRVAPDFPANERVNPPLRDFFAGEDPAGMGLADSGITAPGSVVALGLDNGSSGFAWVRDAENEYGTGSGPGDLAARTISGVSLAIAGFTDGTYRVEVHDPWGVLPVDDGHLAVASGSVLTVVLPDFTRDIALKIRPTGSADPADPVTAMVTSPGGGPVTITESATSDPPPVGSGYTYLAYQVDITAPAATAETPLTLVFTVDASLLASTDPDLTADTLAVFREGVPVDACTATGADDPATPDPCVSLRETLAGGNDEGDARITVLSSHASTWNVGSAPMLTVPGAPTGATATRGDAKATVTWTAPADDGGSAITGYTVTASPGGATAMATGAAITSAVVTGLTNGTSYTFTVHAANAVGAGPESAPSNTVTPQAPVSQAITFAKPANQLMTASPFTAVATATSGLPVSLTSSTSAVCTANGLVITFVVAGTCTVTAEQAGNDDYLAAVPVTRSFVISQAPQSIKFANPGGKTLVQTPFTVTATSSSGLPVTVSSTTTVVCAISGFEVTLLTPGTCSLTASQAGDSVYKQAPSVTRSFAVTKASQSITFTNPGNKTMLLSPFTVTATASSGLTVTLISTTPAVCAVSGFEVTLLGPGTCSLTASQPGNEAYAAASSVTRSFTVTKVSQSVTFANPGGKTLVQTPLSVTATASSGLPVTITTTTTGVCTISGFQVTLLATGTCTLSARQPGNAVYAAAPVVNRSFTVTKAPQTITLPNPGPQSMLVPIVVLSPWASSNLAVTLSSTTSTVCTVAADTVTLKKAGTCKIKAVQAGNATYAAAPAVTVSFAVSAATSLPLIVASGPSLTAGGQPFAFHGASIYGTSNPGGPNDPARIVALATNGGLNTLRIVNPFDERGLDGSAPFVESDWQRVDRLLARARGAGLRIVLDLSAFRNHLVNRDIRVNGWEDACLPGADRSPVDYTAIDPYRAGLEAEWEAFLDFVTNRVNTVNGVRYSNDSTIAVISIAGEPQPPASEECGKATSTAGLTDFFSRTLAYLATVDTNHLRSSGGLIHLDWQYLYGGGGSGIDGAAIFAMPENTLPALHTYPPQYAGDGTPIDYQTPDMSAVAAANAKPWFTEEFGWTQSTGDATRAERYAWLYGEQATHGSSGALFWNLGLEVAGGSHDVNPSTPLAWAEVRAH